MADTVKAESVSSLLRWCAVPYPALTLYLAARDLLAAARAPNASEPASPHPATTFYQTGLQRGLEAYDEAGGGPAPIAQVPDQNAQARRYSASALAYYRKGGLE